MNFLYLIIGAWRSSLHFYSNFSRLVLGITTKLNELFLMSNNDTNIFPVVEERMKPNF